MNNYPSIEQLEINTDRSATDRELVYEFLSRESYWARDIPRALFDKSLENSLCFNAFLNQQQVGFARVITDFATYGYLADVFVIEVCRGKGISKRLMQAISTHPELQMLRRITLATSDAHELYRQFGFSELKSPEIFMEKHQPGLYQKLKSAQN